MTTRLTCPNCQEQLTLKRPTIASTKIKCRSCGTKFYAGKATTGQGAASDAPLLIAPTAEAPSSPPRSKERRSKADGTNPRWLVPAIIGGTICVIALAIYFRPQPPPVPQADSTSFLDAGAVAPVERGKRNDSTTLFPDTSRGYRPDSLVGDWELQDEAGGTIELAKDGTVRVKAPLLDANILDFTSTWFVVRVDGRQYDLEFGKQPARVGNHCMTVRVQDDGQLRLLKYATTTGFNFNPRLLKRKS